MTNEQEPNAEDVARADELRAHHAVMIEDLDRLSAALVVAAESGNEPAAAKRDLEQWVTEVLVPHAEEEEATTYRVAGELPSGELLIMSMLAEHELIRTIARRMSGADDPSAAGAFAQALFDTFDSHQRKENDIILPLLVASDTVSLVEVTAGLHGHHHHNDHGHSDHGHDSHDH